MDKQLQNNLSKEHRKHGVVDQVKYKKNSKKMTDIEYHVQENADDPYKRVKIYFNTDQLSSFPFCGTHPKPHGARELSKHYYLRFDTKLGHGICAICCIPCACVVCTSMLDQHRISGIYSKKQSHYQPVTNCTYWPVISSYNNWNIIHLSQKSTPFEAF